MSKQRFFSFLSLLLVIALVITGCVPRKRGSEDETEPVQQEEVYTLVAMKANETLAGQIGSGDVVRVYGLLGSTIPELLAVEVYQADPENGTLLLKLADSQVKATMAYASTNLVLIAKAGTEAAEEALRHQKQVLSPEVTVVMDAGMTLVSGQTATVSPEIRLDPEDGICPAVTMQSDNDSVVRIENGVMSAVAPGTATVTVRCGKSTARCSVRVVVPVEGLSLDHEYLEIYSDDTGVGLTATVYPENASDVTLEWSTSDSGVLNVTQAGFLVPTGIGTAVVTVQCGSASASCTVVVGAHTQYIEMDTSPITVVKDNWIQLNPVRQPAGAMDPIVITSSDPNVVRVDESGNAYAVAAGTAAITVQSGSAVSVVTVTVTKH
ncbi:MAG: Ig domain-containing protein [Faecousia sp.]